MNISPISGSSSDSDPVVQQPAVPSSSQPLPATGAQNAEDTVQLSAAAQVQQLSQEGESASLIASSTGQSLSEVDSELGITTTSTTSVPVAAMGGGGGGHAAAAPAAGSSATPTAAASSAAPPAPASPALSVLA